MERGRSHRVPRGRVSTSHLFEFDARGYALHSIYGGERNCLFVVVVMFEHGSLGQTAFWSLLVLCSSFSHVCIVAVVACRQRMPVWVAREGLGKWANNGWGDRKRESATRVGEIELNLGRGVVVLRRAHCEVLLPLPLSLSLSSAPSFCSVPTTGNNAEFLF